MMVCRWCEAPMEPGHPIHFPGLGDCPGEPPPPAHPIYLHNIRGASDRQLEAVDAAVEMIRAVGINVTGWGDEP